MRTTRRPDGNANLREHNIRSDGSPFGAGACRKAVNDADSDTNLPTTIAMETATKLIVILVLVSIAVAVHFIAADHTPRWRACIAGDNLGL